MCDLPFAEIARFGADGKQSAIVVMALVTFIDVRDLVSEVVRAVCIFPFDGNGIGDKLQSGFGLRIIPNVEKRSPTGLCVDQKAGFDEFFGIAGREGERFLQDGSDGQIEDGVFAILGRGSLGHPDEAVFAGVVGEEWSAQGVRNDAIVGLQAAACFGVKAPGGEFFRKGLGEEEMDAWIAGPAGKN